MMILGSDQRYGDKKLGIKPRSDTIILVRLDPDKEATAVMSIPRDLKVDIPGYGNDRDQRRLRARRPAPHGQDRQEAVRRRAVEPFKINHIVNVDFGGFRKVVNYIGGVYVDIDRDYFNDNSGGESFATIDVNPGYQKLKGQDALDYVRYRHGDNDLVRARAPAGLPAPGAQRRGHAASCSTTGAAASSRRSSPATPTPTRACGASRTSSRCSSSSSSPAASRSARSASAIDLDRRPGLPDGLARTSSTRPRSEFLNAQASEEAAPDLAAPPTPTASPPPARKKQQPRGRRARPRGRPRARARTRRSSARGGPTSRSTSRPCAPAARATRAPSRASTRIQRRARQEARRAYRLVVSKGVVGEYYGIQGTTWREPPILDDPSETRKVNGRKLELHYDGKRLRLVAWRTKRAVYWVSNTLTQSPQHAPDDRASPRRCGGSARSRTRRRGR